MTRSSSLIQAALVLNALPRTQAAKVIARLKPDDIRTVMTAITRLDDVAANEVNAAVTRFVEMTHRRRLKDEEPASPVKSAARQLNEVLGMPDSPIQKMKPGKAFDFLRDVLPVIRCHLLRDEHPRNVAIVLSLLPPKTASETIRGLDDYQSRVSVLRRLCELDEVASQEVAELAITLKHRLKAILNTDDITTEGFKAASDLLSCDDSADRESLITHLNQFDPELGQKLKRRVFILDRLIGMSEQEIKTILQHADTSHWAPALKNASAALQQKILKSMAPSVAQLLRREILELALIDPAQEELARQNIIQTVLQLDREGKLNLGSVARGQAPDGDSQRPLIRTGHKAHSANGLDATSLIN